MTDTQERVEGPDVPSNTLVGFRVQVRPRLETPALVKTAPDKLTVPVNPPFAATVMVELPVFPSPVMGTEVGLADREKSPATVTVTVAAW